MHGTGAAEAAEEWARLLPVLRERQATVATAESLTGGQLAAALTSVPGASAAFAGGVVSYATAVKVSLLGVPEELVAEHGVVSAACARAMASGVRELVGTSYGVATTGVAGPEQQEGHPVGTVFVAVADADATEVRQLALTGDRAAIQARALVAAVSELAAMMGTE
ncbi:nicotinamide-nucleotide amidohydrolase family protein [Nocardioides panacisoli]|uniref:CinA family protein n=1 Tax=Nocardioides panacisoli TaxID=627624 RepID=UPI001C628C7D|nr:nicotinamide-nucleotide amidohydrolase family protein [Nocardioides panacisoli]QYJ05310.1 nicotinamide-nucleotide amidohydrolase family protein [Nocardioides panacisoli]